MIEDVIKSLKEDGFTVTPIEKWYLSITKYNVFKKDVMDVTFLNEDKLRLWYFGYRIGREYK